MPSSNGLLGRLSLFLVLASGLVGCGAGHATEAPCAFSFRPTLAGSSLWISTPIAVELANETDARVLEAVDPMYVGELAVRGGRIRPLPNARHELSGISDRSCTGLS